MSEPLPTPELPLAIISGGVELAVARLGRGPRLICLHGGPGLDHHLLLPLARRLQQRFEVWLPDLPGHGASAGASRSPGLAVLEERLGRWLSRLPGDTAGYLGHSMGALLLRELLRRGRIPALPTILVSPPAGGPPLLSAVRRARDLLPEDGRDERQPLLRHLRAELQRPLPPELVEVVQQSRLRSPAAFPALLRNLHRRLSIPPRRFQSAAPVLVISGDADQTTPPAHAARVCEATEGSRFVLLEGGGHYLIAERPAAVAALVGELLG